MGARWGVDRTVAQIHALLYLTAGRCTNVSTSLRELQNRGLVRLVHPSDDRRDHYETSTPVWELMRTIVREPSDARSRPRSASCATCAPDAAPGPAPKRAALRRRRRAQAARGCREGDVLD